LTIDDGNSGSVNNKEFPCKKRNHYKGADKESGLRSKKK